MKKVYVAKIGKTVGLKGFSKLYIDSDFPEQFKKGSRFFTDKNKELIVESYNQKNETVKFEGVESVEEAKKLTNRLLYSSQEDTKQNCQLGQKQYFWFDIINCEIVEDNEILGVVEDIQRLPLSDYLSVATTNELVQEDLAKSFMIPYLDQYILDVDIASKTITVKGAKDILEAS
jgi:16S rRNA processing protein RimM